MRCSALPPIVPSSQLCPQRALRGVSQMPCVLAAELWGSWQVSQRPPGPSHKHLSCHFPWVLAGALRQILRQHKVWTKSLTGSALPAEQMLENSTNHPGTGIVEATRFLRGVAVRTKPAGDHCSVFTSGDFDKQKTLQRDDRHGGHLVPCHEMNS